MKQYAKLFIYFLLVGIACLNCAHEHSVECGTEGINCTHQCYEIVPCEEENMPY